ncbi:MAG: hypothetical protein ACRCV5_10850, partial [Afipia sp.]
MNNAKFSPLENQLLAVLGKKKMTLVDIAGELWTQPRINPNNQVASIVRRINAKCELYKLDWHLNGDGAGRGGRTIW